MSAQLANLELEKSRLGPLAEKALFVSFQIDMEREIKLLNLDLIIKKGSFEMSVM